MKEWVERLIYLKPHSEKAKIRIQVSCLLILSPLIQPTVTSPIPLIQPKQTEPSTTTLSMETFHNLHKCRH